MEKKMMKIAILSILLLMESTTTTAFAADTIRGAFSVDVSETVGAYRQAYGWNEKTMLLREWNARITGKGTVTFHRMSGYQDYYLSDNILTTQLFLGMTDRAYGVVSSVAVGNALLTTAAAELRAKDHAENPAGSNRVKYNTWYAGETCRLPWSATFLAYCADAGGYISGATGRFLKTADVSRQYQHLKRQFPRYEITTTTPFGGQSYTPVAGDIIFFTSGADYTDFVRVGIIASVGTRGIYVIEGDINDKVEQTYYSVEEMHGFLRSEIIHVLY